MIEIIINDMNIQIAVRLLKYVWRSRVNNAVILTKQAVRTINLLALIFLLNL